MRALLFALGAAALLAMPALSARADDDNGPYGAIATSGGNWGVAYNQDSKSQAERVAKHECNSVADDCSVQVWFKGHGVCGAVVQKGDTIGWGWAKGEDNAVSEAKSSLPGGELIKVECND